MTVTSGLALLRVSATTNSWTVKTIVRSIWVIILVRK
jgi:hypothetical protein